MQDPPAPCGHNRVDWNLVAEGAERAFLPTYKDKNIPFSDAKISAS